MNFCDHNAYNEFYCPIPRNVSSLEISIVCSETNFMLALINIENNSNNCNNNSVLIF